MFCIVLINLLLPDHPVDPAPDTEYTCKSYLGMISQHDALHR